MSSNTSSHSSSRSTSTSSSRSTSSTSSSSSSDHRTVVSTDGGSVEVTGEHGALVVVDVVTEPGWEVHVDRPDDRHLDATFTTAGRRAQLTVVLTDGGFTSSTSSSSGT